MSQEDNFSLEVQFTFWPSIDEMKQSASTNLYVGGLQEHLDSLEELKAKLKSERIQVSDTRDEVLSAGIYPETLVSFILFIGSTGIVAGLYNLLKTWVDSKNGRKLRVKIGALEVETTQMSEEQFFNFLKKVKEFEDSRREANSAEEMLAIRKQFSEYFLKANYGVLRADSVEYASESHLVTSEAHESIRRVRESPSTSSTTQKALQSKRVGKVSNPKQRKNKR